MEHDGVVGGSTNPASASAVARRRGGLGVWLACGAAVLAGAGGVVTGVAAHSANPTDVSDRGVVTFLSDQPDSVRVVEYVDLSPDAHPVAHALAWTNASHQYCVGLIWPGGTLQTDCAESSVSTALAANSNPILLGTAVRHGNSMVVKAGDKDATFDAFGFVGGVASIKGEWDGLPATVRLERLPVAGGSEVYAFVLESPPSSVDGHHVCTVLAYDSSGGEIGRTTAAC